MDKRTLYDKIAIDQGKKQQALEQIQRAVSKKKLCYKPSIFALLADQLRFISFRYWILQAGFMAVSFCLLSFLKRNRIEHQEMILVVSILFSLIGLIGINELGRSISCGTAELEQSCYFNFKQLFCLKMLLFGGIDILFFSIIIPMNHMEYSIFRFAVYTLVPFVVSNGGYLLFFSIFRDRNESYSYVLIVIFTIFCILPGSFFPKVFDGAYMGIWCVILAVSMVVLGIEIRLVLSRLDKGEIVCTN